MNAPSRPRFRRPTLGLQLLVAFTCAALLPLLLLGYAQLMSWQESEEAHADRETLLSSTSLAREIGGMLEARAEIVRTLAAELSATPELSRQALEALTDRFLRASPGFYVMEIADPSGMAIGGALHDAQGTRPVHGTSYADREYVKRIQSGADFAASSMLRSKLTGRPAIILAARVPGADGGLRAIVLAGVDLSLVELAVTRVTLAAPGLFSVISDASGSVVAADSSSALAVLDKTGERELFAPPTGPEPERRHGDFAGQARRGVVSRIQSNVVDWSALCSWPEELVQARARSVAHMTLAVVLGALILGLGLAIGLARLVGGPVAKLAGVVAAIGHGDLHVRLEPPDFWYGQELCELSSAIEETLFRLHALLRQIAQTALALSDVTHKLGAESTNLLRESQEQQRAVRHGSGAIVQMADSIAGVSSGTRDLSQVASETSASLSSLDLQIAQIAGSIKALTETIDAAGKEVDEMGEQVDATASTAAELATNVVGTTESVDTLAHSIEGVIVSAAQSEKLAQEAIVAAEAGRSAVDATIGASHQIQESFDRVQQVVEGLASRSEAIWNVVRMIDEVTRATQLLAINASIIASQAGEHGKSFAIVADRVKELAQETVSSTREIEKLIDSVQGDIQQAVQAVAYGQETVLAGKQRSDEAGRRLQLIIASSSEAERQVREIGGAMSVHSDGLRQVRLAISDVSGITRRLDVATSAQRQAQQGMTVAIERARKVGRQVEASTTAQKGSSHAMAAAVREITERLKGVAAASQSQHDERARIELSLGTFQGASHISVERAHQIDAVTATLRARLSELERQLKAFRFD